MAEYWRVSPKIWPHAKRMRWDADTTQLALYLLTCPHRTTEGMFLLPKAYVAADLQWTPKQLEGPWQRLTSEDFIDYDDDCELLLIVKAMKYQRPDNENQHKAAIRALSELPASRLWKRFAEAAEAFAEPFAKALAEALPQWIPDSPAPSLAPDSSSTNTFSSPGGDADKRDGSADEPARPEFDDWLDTFNGFTLAKEMRRRPWQATGKLRSQFRTRRSRWSYDELVMAAMNLHDDAYMCGDNPGGKVYATPEYILRNDENVSKYQEPPKRRATGPPSARPVPLRIAGGEGQ